MKKKYIKNETDFQRRLSYLRETRGMSARQLSLTLLQNKNYINTIESGKASPTLASFFDICKALRVTPAEFFDIEYKNPENSPSLEERLHKLTPSQTMHMLNFINDLIENNGRGDNVYY